MSADDPIVTLTGFLKLEAPGGDVRLCDGGMLSFDGEIYEAEHPVFGSVVSLDGLEAGFSDLAEAGTLVLAPNGVAAVADWWGTSLETCRVRLWLGEVAADGFTVSSAKLLADWLVDVETRQQDAGEDRLELSLIGRAEKLFLRNEGNVCSTRFHQTVFPGERGFENCTDVQGNFAWGAESPPRSGGTYGGGGGGWVGPSWRRVNQ